MSIQYVLDLLTSLKLNLRSMSSSRFRMKDIYLLCTTSYFLLFFTSLPFVSPNSEIFDRLLDLLSVPEFYLLLNALIASLYFIIDLLFELVLLLMAKINSIRLIY